MELTTDGIDPAPLAHQPSVTHCGRPPPLWIALMFLVYHHKTHKTHYYYYYYYYYYYDYYCYFYYY